MAKKAATPAQKAAITRAENKARQQRAIKQYARGDYKH